MMTPTNHVTLTPEAQTRKLHRLIARELERRNPHLYAELEAQALATMEFDNVNPTSTIIGAERTRKSIRIANAIKKIEREEAMAVKFHPVKKPSLTTYMDGSYFSLTNKKDQS